MTVRTPTRTANRASAPARLTLLATLLLLATQAARAADSPLKIPLEPLGYQTLQTNFLLAGSSMMTVHFVDPHHLLVTFALRKLMHRDERTAATAGPEDPDDVDRTIGARLIEIPSRKLLASTEWRVHDHGQYLWPLTHGRFLLRIKDQLSVIAPLDTISQADSADPFHQTPILHADLHILAVLVSPEGDLVTVESAERAPPAGVAANVHFSGEPAPQPGVQLNFYRLASDTTSTPPRLRSAGVLRARAPLSLPVTTSGFLDVIDGTHNRWLFDFDTHAGQKTELAELQSSCFPRTTFVTHTEFVAFGCRGAQESQMLAGFNIRGEEMWQQNLSGIHVSPTFSFAPESGRFALGRMLVTSLGDPIAPEFNEETTDEEVRVYQMHTGKLLLRADCTPTQRAGQNFALSPDGLKLAVIHETGGHRKHPEIGVDPVSRTAAIEIYSLPPQNKQDEAFIQAERAAAPPDSDAPIRMTASAAPAAAAARKAVSPVPADEVRTSTPVPVDPTQQPAIAPPAAPAPPAPGTGPSLIEGDTPEDGPRKPPTLYGPQDAPSAQRPK